MTWLCIVSMVIAALALGAFAVGLWRGFALRREDAYHHRTSGRS